MDLPTETNLLAQPTRASLFAALQRRRQAATTDELADQLGLHVNGVRRHLERMQEAGLLERHSATRGRGRPRDEWSIAPGASPSGAKPEAYGDLARWLVRVIADGPGGLEQVERSGREIGRELVAEQTDDFARSFTEVVAALGFQPSVEPAAGRLHCTLGNCPYRASAGETPEVICSLHKGLTEGILDALEPDARLLRFEPHDPDRAGCVIEVATADAPSSVVAAR